MKHTLLIVCLMTMTLQSCPTAIFAAESEFETFLRRFDYEVRDELKIDSKELVPLMTAGKPILHG